MRVLIAEDEPNIAESLCFVLAREGFEVRCVADGAIALRCLLGDPPDVLLLDLMLPGLNGYEVLKRVRADAGLASLPVLVLTARTQAHERARVQALGAHAMITKPFSNKEVVATLRRLAGEA